MLSHSLGPENKNKNKNFICWKSYLKKKTEEYKNIRFCRNETKWQGNKACCSVVVIV